MKVLLETFVAFYLISTSYSQVIFPEDDKNLKITSDKIMGDLAALRGTPQYEDYIDTLIVKGITKLALSFNAFDDGTLDSIVYSPVSIAGALALVLMASNGRTFDEVATLMGLAIGIDVQTKSQAVHEHFGRLVSNLNSNAVLGEQVKFATAVFVQNNFPIRRVFRETSQNIYKSEVLNLDFYANGSGARDIINAWVSDKTNGKIASLLMEPPPSITKVIIASVLYFKGAWEKPFFEGFTRRRHFYPDGRRTQTKVTVEMMSNGGQFPYYKDSELDCEVMGFPYKGNQTTMYVVMPIGSSRRKLLELKQKLGPVDLNRLVANTKYMQSVILFPKMTLESVIDLSSTLQSMGVRSLFNPATANLALLSSGSYPITSADTDFIDSQRHGNANGFVNSLDTVSSQNRHNMLIFSRIGSPDNCTKIFEPDSNVTKCQEVDETSNKQVIYKKFGNKVGRRIARETNSIETLDSLRNLLNKDPNNVNVENPGLYADQVLHKVYIDVTETGTEAAAATSVSLSRGGDIITFRVDVPFLFFIRDEQSKLILFWGSVNVPSPTYN